MEKFEIKHSNIWNVDETSLQAEAPEGMAIHCADTPTPLLSPPPRVQNATLLCAVGSDGQPLHPHLIYPLASIPPEFDLLQRADVTVHCAGQGWIDVPTFETIMTQFILPACREKMKKGKSANEWGLVIMDGHVTRRNLTVIETALMHKLQILILPSHCTHVLQPLDLSVFATFKTSLSQNYVPPDPFSARGHRAALASALRIAMAEAFQLAVIESSFRKSGIVPLDSEPVFHRCRKLYPKFDDTASDPATDFFPLVPTDVTPSPPIASSSSQGIDDVLSRDTTIQHLSSQLSMAMASSSEVSSLPPPNDSLSVDASRPLPIPHSQEASTSAAEHQSPPSLPPMSCCLITSAEFIQLQKRWIHRKPTSSPLPRPVSTAAKRTMDSYFPPKSSSAASVTSDENRHVKRLISFDDHDDS